MVGVVTAPVDVRVADTVKNPVDVIAALVDVTPAAVVVASVDNSWVVVINVEPMDVRPLMVVSTLVEVS